MMNPLAERLRKLQQAKAQGTPARTPAAATVNPKVAAANQRIAPAKGHAATAQTNPMNERERELAAVNQRNAAAAAAHNSAALKGNQANMAVKPNPLSQLSQLSQQPQVGTAQTNPMTEEQYKQLIAMQKQQADAAQGRNPPTAIVNRKTDVEGKRTASPKPTPPKQKPKLFSRQQKDAMDMRRSAKPSGTAAKTRDFKNGGMTKPMGYAKGGMANCGASMKPAQKGK